MKKWIYTGIAIAAALLLMGAAAEQAIRINQFGGLLEDTDPLALPDGMASESNNVITDLGTGLESRDGYIAYATEPAKALWVFAKSNGTRYVIAHSGNNLKADSGAKTFALAVSTVAAGIVTAGAQLGTTLLLQYRGRIETVGRDHDLGCQRRDDDGQAGDMEGPIGRGRKARFRADVVLVPIP